MKKYILFLLACSVLFSENSSIVLQVKERNLEVNGRSVKVFDLVQPDGTWGIVANKEDQFDVIVENQLSVPTGIHWHGIILPNDQDGVPFVTQYPIYPRQNCRYTYPIVQAGTFWMHSHFSLQVQRLMSAPLILLDPAEPKMADQDAVIFLSDFSFEPPEKILQKLQCNPSQKMDMPDIVEVNYDAFLANYRTLADPDVKSVQPGQKVRLRVINGSAATNFFIFIGNLNGEAIAVDGNRIVPITASCFELAVAQRIDIVVTIPKEGGVFPILAQPEGTDKQTGVVLATPGRPLPKLSSTSSQTAGALTNNQEALFRAKSPLPSRPVDQRLTVELGGNMQDYVWTINGQVWPDITPLIFNPGSRVEIVFKNSSTMSHPMHLHGHVFQVVALGDKTVRGAMRDTVLVPPFSTVAIQLDANNPGVWPLHCHVLYHQAAGMMTVVRYQGFNRSR